MEEYESLRLALKNSGTHPFEVLFWNEGALVEHVKRSVNEIRRFKADFTQNVNSPSTFVHSDMLSTGCAELDQLLGGGLARGCAIEICGPAATGKTCLACQIAVQHSQFCVYISSEQSIPPLVMRMKSIAESTGQNNSECRFLQVHSLSELRIGLNKLKPSPSLKVVIIDSITEALSGMDPHEVATQLDELDLKKYAFDLNVAIVLTNQVRDSRRSAPDLYNYQYFVQEEILEGDASPYEELRKKAANGWALSQHVSARLMLTRPGPSAVREAKVVFSGYVEQGTLKLDMTQGGLVSHDEPLTPCS